MLHAPGASAIQLLYLTAHTAPSYLFLALQLDAWLLSYFTGHRLFCKNSILTTCQS